MTSQLIPIVQIEIVTKKNIFLHSGSVHSLIFFPTALLILILEVSSILFLAAKLPEILQNKNQ